MTTADLFHLDIRRRTAEPGMLLVAQPFLRESYFKHAVILLIDGEDNPGGSMGVVLNRATDMTLAELLPDGQVKAPEPLPVNCGGPLSEDRLFFIHTLGTEIIADSRQVCPGLWIGGSFDDMLAYVNSGYPIEGHIRFFLGYSGWSKGQLAEELQSGTWAVGRPLPDVHAMLAGNEDPYWHKIVRSLGPDYKPWLYHPQNPMAN